MWGVKPFERAQLQPDQMVAATASSWSGSKPDLLFRRCRGADVLVVWHSIPGRETHPITDRFRAGCREALSQQLKVEPVVDHHGPKPMLQRQFPALRSDLLLPCSNDPIAGIPPRRAVKQFRRLNRRQKSQVPSEATRALKSRPAVWLWRHRAPGKGRGNGGPGASR